LHEKGISSGCGVKAVRQSLVLSDPPGDGEMKLKYETLEAENREMHVRNSTLA
jgi:hypothetical protein